MAEKKKLGKRNADWNYGGARFRLSRSKINLFTECPRCFYLDNKLGVARPRGPAFTLNIAVDELLKKEFDVYRKAGSAHPLMKAYGLDAVPFAHASLNTWRENFEGIEYFHEPTGFVVSGAIDDVWKAADGSLIVVDYKATAKDGKMESLSDTKWEQQYKKQLEIYQWLLRQNKFKVSDTGYFVYVNGKKDKKAFDGKLEFDVTLIAHIGDDSWVEGILFDIKKCLDGEVLPHASDECEFCAYRKNTANAIFTISPKAVPLKKDDETALPKSKRKNENKETFTESLF